MSKTKQDIVRIYSSEDGYMEAPASDWLKELEIKNHKLMEIKNKQNKTESDINWLINEVFDLQQSYHIFRHSNEDLLKLWNEQRREILSLKGLCVECEGQGGFDEPIGEEFDTIPCEACNGTGKDVHQ